jgi:hypothetical protein
VSKLRSSTSTEVSQCTMAAADLAADDEPLTLSRERLPCPSAMIVRLVHSHFSWYGASVAELALLYSQARRIAS